MSQYLRFCPNCNSKDLEYKHKIRGRYATYLDESNYTCEVCGNQVVDLNILSDEYKIIVDISSDPAFIKAMIELHDTDIIEYNLKISQFKSQLEQQGSSKVQNDTTPRCPHCKSTNIKSISALNRGASIAMLGVFSKKINKSFECLNCKYTW